MRQTIQGGAPLAVGAAPSKPNGLSRPGPANGSFNHAGDYAARGKRHIEEGERFGFLVALRGKKAKRCHVTICRCDCGQTTEIRTYRLLNGHTKSCGCGYHAPRTHGEGSRGSSTPEYSVWSGMRSRCQDKNDKNYQVYGARGIRVCERWNDYAAFLADMGRRPSPKHSLDRYPDTNGNYEPGNCRWATQVEQRRNQRTAKFYEFNGERLMVTDIAKITGIGFTTIMGRLQLGWPPKVAFLAQPGAYRRKEEAIRALGGSP